jgi:hypothetical protein
VLSPYQIDALAPPEASSHAARARTSELGSPPSPTARSTHHSAAAQSDLKPNSIASHRRCHSKFVDEEKQGREKGRRVWSLTHRQIESARGPIEPPWCRIEHRSRRIEHQSRQVEHPCPEAPRCEGPTWSRIACRTLSAPCVVCVGSRRAPPGLEPRHRRPELRHRRPELRLSSAPSSAPLCTSVQGRRLPPLAAPPRKPSARAAPSRELAVWPPRCATAPTRRVGPLLG